MLTSDFDYFLPPELIAQSPAKPRDSSRLMVLDKKNKTIEHKHFFGIEECFRPGDLLVWNNSKVFKARLRGSVFLDEKADDISDKREKQLGLTDRILNMPTVEIFLVRPMENFGVWKALAKPGRKLRLGMMVKFAEDFACEVIMKEKDGTILVQFEDNDVEVRAKANRYGEVPTPPYIKNSSLKRGARGVFNDGQHPPTPLNRGDLREQYQTVYAKYEGSVAAPTAGFHFTPELVERLGKKGVQFAEVTLHVGLGTFLPVKSERVEDHRMHSEWVELTAKNADLINQAKAEGRRVVAVGTTTVRTLEGIARLGVSAISVSRSRVGSSDNEIMESKSKEIIQPYTGDINLFITPGFTFHVVDALITNFHLPKSTLLMLAAAFVGDRKFILDCYQKAVAGKYRFYSFGDAMFIQ